MEIPNKKTTSQAEIAARIKRADDQNLLRSAIEKVQKKKPLSARERKAVEFAEDDASVEDRGINPMSDKIHQSARTVDAVEFAGLMRTFASAQKHTALMQQKAEEWARRMGVTLYADEAAALYGSALQTILQQVDLMAAKISPLCTDPERARDVIEDYAQKLRLSATEAIQSHEAHSGR